MDAWRRRNPGALVFTSNTGTPSRPSEATGVYGSPPKTSFMGQGSFGRGGKKRKTRKSTSSSRVQRRSKTQKSRRATGGGR